MFIENRYNTGYTTPTRVLINKTGGEGGKSFTIFYL